MAATLDDSRPLLESGDEEEDVIYGDVEKEEKVEGEKEREGRRVRRERRGEGGGDPVLEAIGEFGPYQAWLCCVGLLMNLVRPSRPLLTTPHHFHGLSSPLPTPPNHSSSLL